MERGAPPHDVPLLLSRCEIQLTMHNYLEDSFQQPFLWEMLDTVMTVF